MNEPKRTFLSGVTYDRLKFLAQILLPALGTLYFALASIWHLPNAEQVVGTIVAVDTFLGVLLGLSTKQYNAAETVNGRFDGAFVPTHTAGAVKYVLELNFSPDELEDREEVILKVDK